MKRCFGISENIVAGMVDAVDVVGAKNKTKPKSNVLYIICTNACSLGHKLCKLI